jgi:hypothetical protein
MNSILIPPLWLGSPPFGCAEKMSAFADKAEKCCKKAGNCKGYSATIGKKFIEICVKGLRLAAKRRHEDLCFTSILP